ncbi:MAG: conjugal transfer protein TraF [Candidatus Tectomicrobia bacterium]|uniref:Conjugal transfer protein TraF n=1 Tax=Tectimicrobiota bacterium TaxID=2528274 RepID=A0A933GKW6_UNCTE|nr:conjugal transfer protein TraF [Candidatus Tectomicrobia bacterium]
MPIRSQRKSIITLLIYFAFLSFPLTVISAEPWWEKKEEGWFFYNEKLHIEPESKPEVTTVHSENTPPLFSEIMKKRGEELLSRAMEEPTMENVKAYMEHNQMMMALSKNFSLVWQRVLMSNPELLSGLLTSDSDKDIYYRQSAERKKEALQKLGGESGLLFFYDTTCPYCVRQAKHLKSFQLDYPFFVVKAITMNGEVLPEFPDSVPDNGIASRLGITAHPAIFLAFPPDRFERVATGLVTPGELRDKLLLYTRDQMPGLANPDMEESLLLNELNAGGGQWSKR